MAEKKASSKKAEETTALQVPDYLKGVQTTNDEMSTGVGVSVPRVSLKGSKFRLIDGEKEERVSEPFNVVILGVEPRNGLSRTWYEKPYNPQSADPPDCSSWDGVRPDPWVSKPQSKLCANCPLNMWGSAKSMSGKKAKACKESKRLIIVKADDIEGTQYVLTVTISSLKALSAYGKWLSQNQLPFSAVITELSFNEESDYPELEFNFNSFLEESDGKMCMSIAEERPWESVISSPQLPGGDGQPRLQAPAEPPSPSVASTEDDVSTVVDNW